MVPEFTIVFVACLLQCSPQHAAFSFCSDSFGTYCKDYQVDECSRSICHGHGYDLLSNCDDAIDDDDTEGYVVYLFQGCSTLYDPNAFCAS